jgi:hypothetical protein
MPKPGSPDRADTGGEPTGLVAGDLEASGSDLRDEQPQGARAEDPLHGGNPMHGSEALGGPRIDAAAPATDRTAQAANARDGASQAAEDAPGVESAPDAARKPVCKLLSDAGLDRRARVAVLEWHRPAGVDLRDVAAVALGACVTDSPALGATRAPS